MSTKATHPFMLITDNLKAWENAAWCYGFKEINRISQLNTDLLSLWDLRFDKMHYSVIFKYLISAVNTSI